MSQELKEIKSIEEIPEQMTREKAAEFYSTHSLGEVWEQLEPVEESFELSATLQENMIGVRLAPEYVRALKRLARCQGVSYRQLIQKWIVERVQQEVSNLAA